MSSSQLRIIPVLGIPRVTDGADLPETILRAMTHSHLRFQSGDVVVITQKVISKSEGMTIGLANVVPGAKAKRLGKLLAKDPRIVELILKEAKRVVRVGHGVIITETKHGFVCANSGVDQSNVNEGYVALLPRYPDRSAKRIRMRLEKLTGKELAVIITDTFGRPWREGQVDLAIGCSGVEPLSSLRGKLDPYGYELRVTDPAIVDEIAAASELVMRKLDLIPVAIVRGLRYERGESGIASLLRDRKLDFFR